MKLEFDRPSDRKRAKPACLPDIQFSFAARNNEFSAGQQIRKICAFCKTAGFRQNR